ncbi:hypothetical protein HELRODRAFT_67423, partial [Helobdella robusta]|uniref:Biogenesis of lysosome-related organelles complex 1 subunit 2 n=1 Tax=Helobdella robusta TaxID=6412 RepID=T1FZ07_HELRO
ELCQDMLNKSVGYFNGELTSTCEEYQLLERMNYESTKKFLEMKDVSVGICSSIENLNVKYANLQPYFEMIDQLEESVTSLEQAIYKVDSYSKRLGISFYYK